VEQEMLALPLVDPVLGTFHPTGKPQMFGRQSIFNLYSTAFGADRPLVQEHRVDTMEFQLSNLTGTAVSDLVGLIDWSALITSASPLLAAVGVKVGF
jgi:hypothetical protein